MNPHDQSFLADFKSIEYRQYSKYAYYRVVVTKPGSNEEYRSEYVRGGSGKDMPKKFIVSADSKNPENYEVDISVLKKNNMINMLVLWLVVIIFSLLCLTLMYYLKNTQSSAWLRNILNHKIH